MAEKTKENHAYNVSDMSFTLKGKKFVSTLPTVALVEGDTKTAVARRTQLIGILNVCKDSYAALTTAAGYTDAQRLEKAETTFSALMEGKTPERAVGEVINVKTANSEISKITDVKKLVELRNVIDMGILRGIKLTAEQVAILAKAKK
jgi:hypothetical protein